MRIEPAMNLLTLLERDVEGCWRIIGRYIRFGKTILCNAQDVCRDVSFSIQADSGVPGDRT